MSDAISTNNINKVIDAAFAHARTSTFLVNPKGVSLAEQLDNPAFRAMVSLDDEKVDKIGKTIKFAESTFKRGLAQAQKNYADVLTLQRGRKAKKRDEGDEEEEEMARELERNERRMKADEEAALRLQGEEVQEHLLNKMDRERLATSKYNNPNVSTTSSSSIPPAYIQEVDAEPLYMKPKKTKKDKKRKAEAEPDDDFTPPKSDKKKRKAKLDVVDRKGKNAAIPIPTDTPTFPTHAPSPIDKNQYSFVKDLWDSMDDHTNFPATVQQHAGDWATQYKVLSKFPLSVLDVRRQEIAHMLESRQISHELAKALDQEAGWLREAIAVAVIERVYV